MHWTNWTAFKVAEVVQALACTCIRLTPNVYKEKIVITLCVCVKLFDGS